jgi:hypothetical protein
MFYKQYKQIWRLNEGLSSGISVEKGPLLTALNLFVLFW